MKKVTPFLKWAGGKRWLASSIATPVLSVDKRYIEPFLGSGAFFFSVAPKKSLLSDMNPELIEVYDVVKNNHRVIADRLEKHQKFHSSEYYYKVREEIPSNQIDRAARFIYLNRTCWNGLYRVNRFGKFNVPIGTKTNVILDSDNWDVVSAALAEAEIKSQDFEESIESARAGDLIFADPPYTVKHNNNGFIKYNESLFSWRDQIRLRDCLRRAGERGAIVISTNAAHDSVRDLYENGFGMQVLERASVLSGNAAYRGKFQELFITVNYECHFQS